MQSAAAPEAVKVDLGGVASAKAVDITKDVASGSEDEVKRLISSSPVVLFSKSDCQFSFELKRTLGAYVCIAEFLSTWHAARRHALASFF
jgi:hypothetical protein